MCNLVDKVIIFATDFFSKLVQQQYVEEVGKSITVVLQINSVYCVRNIVEIDRHL